jgi:ubiquinone/menaquinone biosynthesis C-methylase UbiE
MKKFAKGDKQIYEDIDEGLSYYQTVGEVYHTARSKSKFHKFFLESIKGVPAPRVLDVGCYIGTELFMLPKTNKQAQYWGVDISENAIKQAKILSKKRGESAIDFQAIDANRPLPFPDDFFDVVYALELIEHLKDPSKFFVEVNRVLKPSGSLIVSSPNETRFVHKIFQFLPGLKNKFDQEREKDFKRHGKAFSVDSSVWDHEAHISLHNFEKWKPIFQKSKFTVTEVEGSSIYGGSRFIGDRPFLLGLTLILDSIVDLLPFKPSLQMCFIASLKKHV